MTMQCKAVLLLLVLEMIEVMVVLLVLEELVVLVGEIFTKKNFFPSEYSWHPSPGLPGL